jgi:large subunit ribosomal protein L31e
MEEIERIYTVPLGAAYDKPRAKRAKRTVKLIRAFAARHMKVGEDFVWISAAVNDAIWASGMKKPPRKLKIITNKDKEGKVTVSLSGEKEAASKKMENDSKKKEKKAAKKPAQKEAEKPVQKAAMQKPESGEQKTEKAAAPNKG